MTRLFRSKSCGVARTSASMFNSNSSSSPPNNSSLKYLPARPKEDDNDDDDEEEEEEEEGDDDDAGSPVTTPFIIISPERRSSGVGGGNRQQSQQLAILDILATALKKSLVTCSVERDDVASSMDIGCPTDVRHVSHVTFDRFNGFLGLPLELQPQLPRKVPSASVSVFGVSANSMQCSYDQRGNSVPTILLTMQKRLYSGGGLQAEGIFRINAENGQEECVRNQLNKGVVPRGIDVHCLAGLIKAWFRELPAGVLDSLTPEQVMHCNTEEECTQLVKLLPPTEAALLDWAINLMADVVKHENDNKMNARNIAMVFAPNMTQMADPLTALIHAVQVMNFLKTLIIKALRERDEESAADARLFPSSIYLDSPKSSKSSRVLFHGQTLEGAAVGNLFTSVTLDRLETDSMEKYWSFHSNGAAEERHESISSRRRMRRRRRRRRRRSLEDGLRGEYEDDDGEGEEEGIFDRLSLKKGVRKLCRHPVFQLSKAVSVKKTGAGGLGIVNSNGRGGGREACA